MLYAYQISVNFLTILFVRPDVERQGGDLVNIWDRFRILSEVDGMDVGLAGVADLNTDVANLLGGVISELLIIGDTAPRTYAARKSPFSKAQRTD